MEAAELRWIACGGGLRSAGDPRDAVGMVEAASRRNKGAGDKRYFMYIPLICIPLYIPLYLYHLPIYKERPALLGAVQYLTYNSVMVSEPTIGSNASA
jgi:hypothetical protein